MSLQSGQQCESAPPQRPSRSRKEHTCGFCNRNFRRAEHLQRHVRTHTNEKPYVCACGAAFPRPDLLKRHRGIAHGSRQPPPGDSAHARDSYATAQATNESQISLFSSYDHYDVQDTQELSFVAGTPNPCHDFADLIDTIGLPLNWEGIFDQSPPEFRENGLAQETVAGPLGRQTNDSGHPDMVHPPSASILPIPKSRKAVRHFGGASLSLLEVTEDQMQTLRLSLAHYQHAVPGFKLPSRQALERYLNAYFVSFDPHLPFIHLPTFHPGSCSLELVLAVACAGAQYRFEHSQAVSMFFAAKSILNERIKEREQTSGIGMQSTHGPLIGNETGARPGENQGTEPPTASSNHKDTSTGYLMDAARCTLCLIVFSAWKSNRDVFRASLSLQSILVQCVREAGLTCGEDSGRGTAWWTWARQESDKRTKFLAFSFLNLMSHAYDQPPLLLASEINLPLPSSSEEWEATTEEQWLAAKTRYSLGVMRFGEVLGKILAKPSMAVSLKPPPSTLGIYVILHGLLQNVLVMRQARFFTNTARSLRADELDSLETALRFWTLIWQQAPDSSLDPLNRDGPIPFTSTSLLGLAYCRICLDSGPFRALESRNPQQIARKLLQIPSIEKGPKLIHALLHATHSLSIAVQLGVEYVARSQGFFWSIQHALCCFEFAVLINRWLHQLADMPHGHILDKQENSILDWVYQIVEDGKASLDNKDDWIGSGSDYRQLAFSVVNLWSYIMKGNIQWEIVTIMGHALGEYAKLTRQAI